MLETFQEACAYLRRCRAHQFYIPHFVTVRSNGRSILSNKVGLIPVSLEKYGQRLPGIISAFSANQHDDEERG